MNALTVTLLCSLTIANAVILKLGSDSEIIAGSFIVKLKTGVNVDTFIASKTLKRNNGALIGLKSDVNRVYNTVFNGFAAQLDDSELKELDSMSEVEYIEPDQVVRVAQILSQNNADWGLARHSSQSTLSGSPYTYRYDASGGSNARVYVIDTGILVAHNEFGGRAVTGENFITGESNTDLNGHGTHCAGTVAGSTYGVAKNATVVGVKVLSASGSGSTAGVISGIEWSYNDAVNNNLGRVNVLSLSLGGGYSAASNAAIAASVQAGVPAAVAAGNSGADACNYSPASEPTAITVAATNLADSITSWSNYGSCVDICAPGNGITSSYIGSNTATATLSGTSMATPHVAGLLAYIGTREGITQASQLETRLKALASSGSLSGLPTGTPNLLSQNELSQ